MVQKITRALLLTGSSCNKTLVARRTAPALVPFLGESLLLPDSPRSVVEPSGFAVDVAAAPGATARTRWRTILALLEPPFSPRDRPCLGRVTVACCNPKELKIMRGRMKAAPPAQAEGRRVASQQEEAESANVAPRPSARAAARRNLPLRRFGRDIVLETTR